MKGLIRWLPGRSWFGRIGWSVVIVMLAMHVAGYYFYGHDRLVANARTFAISLAERTFELDRLLIAHPDILPVIQTPGFELRRVEGGTELERSTWPHLDEIITPVRHHLAALGAIDPQEVQISYAIRRGSGRMQILLPSGSGGFLLASAVVLPDFETRATSGGAFMSLLLLLIVIVVLWVIRRQSHQLDRFVAAAESVSRGQSVELPENVGPKELRRASRAFNEMQCEVLRLLSERGDMLAGVSHDIRTLATRLGLRLEQLQDSSEREKATRDILLITDLLDQVLTFTRDEATVEATERVDIVPMLQALIDENRSDTARLLGRQSLVLACQPLATMRLFLNLIENAVKYGGRAEVQVFDDRVEVWDPGQGFADGQIDQALKPYSRLDESRSQNQPGAGLGLAIALNVCRRHNWDLRFERRDEGFSVVVLFGQS